ncbi:MAG TPA: adenosylcobinamide-phosphate synthase CbiB [Novosphingobium sp.]
MVDTAPLAALALDVALGWPGWLHTRVGHPVGIFAGVIDGCTRRFNRPRYGDAARRWLGGLTVVVLVTGTLALAWAVECLVRGWLGPAGWPVIALLAWPGLAQRSLDEHYLPIVTALKRGDIVAAQQRVGMIVGRDTGDLDPSGIACAAIESLAESFCDGVVAPLLWFVALGLPGLWACKAINTADSLIGHKEAPFTDFGMVAARTDDVLNLIPARLSAILLCLAAGGGWRVLWRDHANHASPNSGWPEAAMAGALGVRLAGPASYDGTVIDKPWIGSGEAPGVQAMARARRVYHRACGLVWIGTGVAAWVL